MRVVKLGGSLINSETLPHWLRVLSEDATSCNLIVPGGGPFADQVRHAQAQAQWSFNDRTAHNMALLAMQQFGLMLNGICPTINLAANKKELDNAIRLKTTVIWQPDIDWLQKAGIEASWAVTSDSLAAWLAQTFAAEQLLLVKSVSFSQAQTTIEQITLDKTVDDAFARFVTSPKLAIRLYNQHDWHRFEQTLVDHRDAGVVVLQ